MILWKLQPGKSGKRNGEVSEILVPAYVTDVAEAWGEGKGKGERRKYKGESIKEKVESDEGEWIIKHAFYEEAQAAVSRADFGNKIGISLKEMRESNYWLRILKELFPSDSEIERLTTESQELKNMSL